MTESVALIPRVVPALNGAPSPEAEDIRFLIESARTGGRFALGEMLPAPRAFGGAGTVMAARTSSPS